MMESALLLRDVSYLYFVSTLLYLLHMAWQRKAVFVAAHVVTFGGFLLHTLGIALRWIESYRMGAGHIPLSNFYESMVFFSWSLLALYGLLFWRYRIPILGVLMTPFAFLVLAYGTHLSQDEIRPLIPALQSDWLAIHVMTCFLGYAAFALSFGVSLLYLIAVRKEQGTGRSEGRRFLPSIALLDEINYRGIALGFPLLTLGIITGAAWANEAWGSYWSWDPKETWSLITWFIYATFLHARIARGWQGRRTAILSIVGFGAVLFTYLGVNFLISGLHSYA